MLLLDPGRTEFDLQFSVLGIPVRVHPLFWVVTLIMGYGRGDPTAILIWIIAVFFSILWHELGHAIMMRRFGMRPRIVLYSMGGLAIASENDHGWLPKSKNSTPQSILISLAGPFAGFMFAAVLAGALKLSGGDFWFVMPNIKSHSFWDFDLSPGLRDNKAVFLLCYYLFFINIFWGLVNLLPVIPLDGGQISREVFMARFGGAGLSYSLQVSCAVAVTVALFSYFGLHDSYMGLMFILLAVSNYQTWQQLVSRY